MTPFMGWRLRADGQRIEPVLILDFVALPVPINGEPVMAVYASLEGDALQGRVGYDYAGAFEVDVEQRATVGQPSLDPGPIPSEPANRRSWIERILGPTWGAHR